VSGAEANDSKVLPPLTPLVPAVNVALTRARKRRRLERHGVTTASEGTNQQPSSNVQNMPRHTPGQSQSSTSANYDKNENESESLEDKPLYDYQDDRLAETYQKREASEQATECIEALSVQNRVEGQQNDAEFADIYKFMKHGTIPAMIGNARRVAKRSLQFSLRKIQG